MLSSACGHHHGSCCIFWVREQPLQVPGHRGLGVPGCPGQGPSPGTAAVQHRDANIPPGRGGAGCNTRVFCQLGTVLRAGCWPPAFGAEAMLSSPSSAAFRAGQYLPCRREEGMEFAFWCQQWHGLCPPWGRALQHGVTPG